MPGTRCLFSNGWRATPSAETTGATVLWLKWIAIGLIVPAQPARLKRLKRACRARKQTLTCRRDECQPRGGHHVADGSLTAMNWRVQVINSFSGARRCDDF